MCAEENTEDTTHVPPTPNVTHQITTRDITVIDSRLIEHSYTDIKKQQALYLTHNYAWQYNDI